MGLMTEKMGPSNHPQTNRVSEQLFQVSRIHVPSFYLAYNPRIEGATDMTGKGLITGVIADGYKRLAIGSF